MLSLYGERDCDKTRSIKEYLKEKKMSHIYYPITDVNRTLYLDYLNKKRYPIVIAYRTSNDNGIVNYVEFEIKGFEELEIYVEEYLLNLEQRKSKVRENND